MLAVSTVLSSVELEEHPLVELTWGSIIEIAQARDNMYPSPECKFLNKNICQPKEICRTEFRHPGHRIYIKPPHKC